MQSESDLSQSNRLATVETDLPGVKQIGEVTQPGQSRIYCRPDGSLTH